MFGPENGVCNYLALEKINGMLMILRIRAFFATWIIKFVSCLPKKIISQRGGGGGGGGGLRLGLRLTLQCEWLVKQ